MFDRCIRPLIKIELRDGPKFVAFDRTDLDEAIDDYKQLVGIHRKKQEDKLCLGVPPRDSTSIPKLSVGVAIKPIKGVGITYVYKDALKKRRY